MSQTQQLAFEAIGTRWVIDVPADTDSTLLEPLIQQRIADFDAHYSRFRHDSLVADMARAAGEYQLPEDAQPLFDLYKVLYDLTDGAMTPLIGQVLVDAGYDASYSLKPGILRTPPTWDEALDYHYPVLRLKKPALLDVGAAGKGYLVDLVGEVLLAQGIDAFCVDAGGDMLVHGEPLEVALEHPGDPTQAIGVAKLTNQSICASAGNRRKWKGYHHIINPHTLQSPGHTLATWVVADSALLADALATALFFVPASRLADHFSFEYLVLNDAYQPEQSAGFPAQLFLAHPPSR